MTGSYPKSFGAVLIDRVPEGVRLAAARTRKSNCYIVKTKLQLLQLKQQEVSSKERQPTGSRVVLASGKPVLGLMLLLFSHSCIAACS